MQILVNLGIRASGAKITEAPTLAFVSRTQTTMTLSITNNDPDPLTDIEIRYASTFFTQSSLSIVNSQNFTITGLAVNTPYNFIATADANGKGFSPDSNTVTQSTLANQTPGITFSSVTTSSLSFTFTNNNLVTASIRTTFVSGSSASTVLSGSTILSQNENLGPNSTGNVVTFSGLNSGSTHTVAAKADINGNLSGQNQSTQTTSIATPSIAFLGRTQTSINMRFTNNNNVSATINRAIGTSCQTPSSGSSVSAGGTVDENFTGLVPNTTYCITATSVIGGNSSSQASSNQTTLANQQPTINFSSKTTSSLSFTFTNNNSVSANIKTTFTAGTTATNVTSGSTTSVSGLAANSPSSVISFTGLNSFSTHTLAARAEIGASLSSQAENTQTTTNLPPSISLLSAALTSLFIRFTNNNNVSIGLRRANATSCQTITTGNTAVTVAAGANFDETFSNLAPGTNYCTTAVSDIGGNFSTQAQLTSTTTALTLPTISQISRTDTTIN